MKLDSCTRVIELIHTQPHALTIASLAQSSTLSNDQNFLYMKIGTPRLFDRHKYDMLELTLYSSRNGKNLI